MPIVFAISVFSKFEESFVSVYIEKGLLEKNVEKKLDIIATEPMLRRENINNANARIAFCHLRQFFGGRSYFESEQKRCSFFWRQCPPTVDKKVLDNKTVIPFWFKTPDQLLQSQLPKVIDASKLKDLMHIDIIVGGDHGGSKFRRMLKVNFH